ncbi:MAG: YajD family HNH nuclease [Gammaproteobacteria bacterium]
MATKKTTADSDKLDRVVAEARRNREAREKSYRERALKLFPWVCGKCGREFTRENLGELTIHHKDHNHDNNPPDGSNWELLCLYCHDDEHARHLHGAGALTDPSQGSGESSSTHRPFAALDSLLKDKH